MWFFRYSEDCYSRKKSEERKMFIIIVEISMENNLNVKSVKIYVKNICNKIVINNRMMTFATNVKSEKNEEGKKGTKI